MCVFHPARFSRKRSPPSCENSERVQHGSAAPKHWLVRYSGPGKEQSLPRRQQNRKLSTTPPPVHWENMTIIPGFYSAATPEDVQYAPRSPPQAAREVRLCYRLLLCRLQFLWLARALQGRKIRLIRNESSILAPHVRPVSNTNGREALRGAEVDTFR